MKERMEPKQRRVYRPLNQHFARLRVVEE